MIVSSMYVIGLLKLGGLRRYRLWQVKAASTATESHSKATYGYNGETHPAPSASATLVTQPSLDNHPRPQSLGDLFLSFTLLALQGFGGVLAVVQRELVEKKRWLTREEFIEEWAVAQIMPGPNVVNISLMIGGRYFGLPGAMAALAGMLVVPLVVVLLLALLYAHFGAHPGVAGALRGMGAVAAGMIAATGLKLFQALRTNPLGMSLCVGFTALCFVAVALLRLPLAYVLAALGIAACAVAYRKITP
jgi:chromate transporter